jgi:predicted phosphate transport protein (TIGR00153 family)
VTDLWRTGKQLSEAWIMFKFLVPKEDAFFAQFDALATCQVEATQTFIDMLSHYGDAPAKERRIKDIEHRADEISHHAIEMLHKTFITPFDRDQILKLVSRMDDVIDLVDSVTRRMSLYGVTEATGELREMGIVLQKACLQIQLAVKSLRNLKNVTDIQKACVEINKLENDGDLLRDAVVAKLFREGRNAIDVFKWKEIYEDVETAIDRCEDVANIIEGVVLENA